MLQKLIEYVLSSSTIREFKTERGHRTRGSVNLWVNSPFGTGKSSIVNPIIGDKLGVLIQDFTMPGLIGTIKKDGTAIIGDVKLLPRTTGVLEEFQDVKHDTRKVLLSLMEDHRYTRTMGFEVIKAVDITADGFSFYADGTRLEIFTQASFLVFSMAYRSPTTLDLALLSRCVPMFLDAAKEEQRDLFVGGKRMTFRRKLIERTREELNNLTIVVPEVVRKDVAEMYDGSTISPEYLARAMWDFTRIAYIQARFEGVNEVDIDIIQDQEWLVHLQELGYAKRSLTKKAYEAYLFLTNQEDPLRTVEVAEHLGMSREYTSRVLSELVKRRLVDRREISKEVVYYVR
jgi:hypothetical protein